jgi:hypothetical protein
MRQLITQFPHHPIEQSQFDIESIESYIGRPKQALISGDELTCLRGLQDVYRQRIIAQQAETSELPSRAETYARSVHTNHLTR